MGYKINFKLRIIISISVLMAFCIATSYSYAITYKNLLRKPIDSQHSEYTVRFQSAYRQIRERLGEDIELSGIDMADLEVRDRHIHLEGSISVEGFRDICRALEALPKDVFSDEERTEFWEWMAYHDPKGDKVQRFLGIGPKEIRAIIFDIDDQDPNYINLRKYAEYNTDASTPEGFESSLKRYLHTSYGIRAVLFDFVDKRLIKLVIDRVLHDIADTFRRDGIEIADLRCTPFRRGKPINHDLLKAIAEATFNEEKRVQRLGGKLEINLVLSFNRGVTKEAVKRGFSDTPEGYKEYIDIYYIEPLSMLSMEELSRLRGVDITGNELNSTEDTLENIPYINYFIEQVQRLRGDKNISAEFIVYAHVGEEARTPEEGVAAVRIYTEQVKQLRYIVHAVYLRYADGEAFKRITDILRDKKIGVLVSPTSNLDSAAISLKELHDHPAARLKEAGVEVYATTDDPAVSGTNLIQEIILLNTILKLSGLQSNL